MAVASMSDLITMVPELSGLDSGTIQIYLDDAKTIIEKQGIDSSHECFAQLQRYMSLHILTISGYIKGPVTSESVADVSASYEGVNSGSITAFETKWLKLYNDLKTSLNGLDCRILS